MKSIQLETDRRTKILKTMADMPFFAALNPEHIEKLLAIGSLLQIEPDEVLVKQGEDSDSFYVLVEGKMAVYHEKEGQRMLLGYLDFPGTVGEMGLILGKPRTATVIARDPSLALKFTREMFFNLLAQAPKFGLGITQGIAQRLEDVSEQVFSAAPRKTLDTPNPALARYLPSGFMARHRVVPVETDGNRFVLGCVDAPNPQVLSSVYDLLPGREVVPTNITQSYFDAFMEGMSGAGGGVAGGDDDPDGEPSRLPPQISQIFDRMVIEGVSDLHLSAQRRPRWRLHGELKTLEDAPVMRAEELYSLLEPIMEERHKQEFSEYCDTDLVYSAPNGSRYRINMYRDDLGVSAAVRLLPSNIAALDDLNVPPVVERFCSLKKGLVLVTGPTGSGKTTTLAAMVDHINSTRALHILTLEDPVEFVHVNEQALVTQREVGAQTSSFTRGLRSALRQDPDVILVGELRDAETVALAMEAANSGHLVLATMHTNSAASTVDRIIATFPSDEQETIRNSLADVLGGVVAQALAPSMDGGRVGVYEVMVPTRAVCNLIREGKTFQIPDNMQTTARDEGHQLQMVVFEELVRAGKVSAEAALGLANDRDGLAGRLGMLNR